MSLQYSSGIRIMNKWMSDSSIGTLVGASEKDFIDVTKACLNRLKELPTGMRLLKEIDESGHVVEIYRSKKLTTGNYQGGDNDDSYVIPLKTVHAPGKTELQRIVQMATQDLSDRSAIAKFFNVGKPKPRFLPKDALARLLGVSLKQLEEMETGKRQITEDIKSRATAHLYAFLSSGKGCSVHVVFNHKRDNLSSDHKKYLPQTHTWQNRPPAIGLGHELIHAWRCMNGKVLYPYGQEEEQMTVGLPPFTYMEFTENKLRLEWGELAVRPDYKHLDSSTSLLQGQKGVVNDDKKWLGDKKNLAAKTKIATAAENRRKAMGYVDDDDSDDDWD